MTTMVPNRKPSTPLMEFYGTGLYRKHLKQTGKQHKAEPGPAASKAERNHRDINIKPTLHDEISLKFYKPFYLNPFGHN